MDLFARALIIADQIQKESPLESMRASRYSSFDSGSGKAFENGQLSLEDLHRLAVEGDHPRPTSGRQELFENLINLYL